MPVEYANVEYPVVPLDLRTLQELLGHKDLRMTMKYAHPAPDHMRKAEVFDSPSVEWEMEILDGHHLDTEGDQTENQDAAAKHNILITCINRLAVPRGIEPLYPP